MPDESSIIESVCSRIKQLRISKSLSQEKMAELLFMSQTAYSLLESGKRKIDIERIIDLADIFDVPVAYFFETMPVSKKKRMNNKK